MGNNKEKHENEYLKTSAVAELLDVTTRRVQQLTKEKIITGEKNKGRYEYDLFTVSKEYIKYLSDKVNGREKSDNTLSLEDSKLTEEVKIKQSKAKMLEMQVAVMEGRMHKAEDVEEMTSDLVLSTRSMLLSLPGRISLDIVKCTAPEASELIEQSVYEILSELSKYRYDPREYRKRVMEDNEWYDDKYDD